MPNDSWIVEKIRSDGWSVLRRDMFIYVVPGEVLPEDVQEGDVLKTDGAPGDDYGRWRVQSRRAS